MATEKNEVSYGYIVQRLSRVKRFPPKSIKTESLYLCSPSAKSTCHESDPFFTTDLKEKCESYHSEVFMGTIRRKSYKNIDCFRCVDRNIHELDDQFVLELQITGLFASKTNFRHIISINMEEENLVIGYV